MHYVILLCGYMINFELVTFNTGNDILITTLYICYSQSCSYIYIVWGKKMQRKKMIKALNVL